MDKKLLILATMFLTNACSMLPDFGKKEETYGKQAERISVLKTDTIAANTNLAELPVEIPKIMPNNQWYKSHGHNALTPENISAPEKFNIRNIESIGKKSEEDAKYAIAPVIAKEKIFTIDGRGKVTAFNVNNIRKEIWTYKIDIDGNSGNFSNAGVLYNEGRIFIATGYNKVIALDAETGELIWSRNINAVARSAPDANDGVLLVNTVENTVYALDIKDGAILWNHSGMAEDISVLGTASPVIYNNISFASYSSGELYALNLKNGNVIWFDNLSTRSDVKSGSFVDIDSAPLIVGDKTFVINNKGTLVAYNTSNGSRLWEIEVSGGKNLWYANKFLYLINAQSQLLAINTDMGAIAWTKQLPKYKKPKKQLDEYLWSGPVLAGDRLLIAGYHGVLLSVSPKNGEIISTTKILEGVAHAPVVAYDSVFLINEKAQLAVYKYSDEVRGKSLTKFVTEGEE